MDLKGAIALAVTLLFLALLIPSFSSEPTDQLATISNLDELASIHDPAKGTFEFVPFPSPRTNSRTFIDVGLDPGSSTWYSGGTEVWGKYCFGQVGETTRVVTKIRNNCTVVVDSIQVTCTIYLWNDRGAWDGGPVVWTNTVNTTVAAGIGTKSDLIEFNWKPNKANSYIVNVSLTTPNDQDPNNNRGFWIGSKYWSGGNYYTTGEWVSWYIDHGDDLEGWTGDIGGTNHWHVAPNVPMDKGGFTHTEPEAYYTGNDDTDNSIGVNNPLSITTPPISLIDFDPDALDPESQLQSPQIYLAYKFAGSIPENNEDFLYVHITKDGGANWTSLWTNETGGDVGHNGSTFNSGISKFEWNYPKHYNYHNQLLFTGVYIGDYVGEEVQIRFTYDPGTNAYDNSRGFWLDDLLIWGRQIMVAKGFELGLPESLLVDLNQTTNQAHINFTLSNLEDDPQSVAISVIDHPNDWSIDTVEVNPDVFVMNGTADNTTHQIDVTITPPTIVEGKTYSFTLAFTGNVIQYVTFSVLVPEIRGITAVAALDHLNLGLGESDSYNITLTNMGNVDQQITLDVDQGEASWIEISLSTLTIPVWSAANVSVTVTVPDVQQAGLKDFNIKTSLPFLSNWSIDLPLTVDVLPYHDLVIYMGNTMQSIRFPENVTYIGSAEYMVHVVNRGNIYDNFTLRLESDLIGDADVLYDYYDVSKPNTNVSLNAYDELGIDIALKLYLPYGAAEGYHNFTLYVDSIGSDAIPDNNKGRVSVKVEYPEKQLVILNFTQLQVNPSPAFVGDEVRINTTIYNDGVKIATDLFYVIQVDGAKVAEVTIKDLDPGHFLEVEHFHEFDSGGSYNITFRLFPYGNLSDLDMMETNTMVMVHQVELAFSDVVIGQENTWFANITEDNMPKGGRPIQVRVNVTNLGSIAAANVEFILIIEHMVNGSYVQFRNTTMVIETVPLNGTGTGTYEFPAEDEAAEYRVTIQMDTGHKYVESNEDDNAYILSFSTDKKDEGSESDLWTFLLLGIMVTIFLAIGIALFIRGLRTENEDAEDAELQFDDESVDDSVFVDDLDDEIEPEEIDEGPVPRKVVPDDKIPDDILDESDPQFGKEEAQDEPKPEPEEPPEKPKKKRGKKRKGSKAPSRDK